MNNKLLVNTSCLMPCHHTVQNDFAYYIWHPVYHYNDRSFQVKMQEVAFSQTLSTIPNDIPCMARNVSVTLVENPSAEKL